MHFTSHISANGILERDFTLDDITGVIWMPESGSGPAPLILSGHSGGMHKRAPGLVASAQSLVQCGYTVAAIDAPGHGDRPRNEQDQQWANAIHHARETGQPLAPVVTEHNASIAERAVPEWQATIDALQALPEIGTDSLIGYGGMTLGVATGLMLAAVEPRIAALSVGPVFVYDALLDAAKSITVPAEFTIAWDDEHIDPQLGIELFDACASLDKSLHIYPGRYNRMRVADGDSRVRFFDRVLR